MLCRTQYFCCLDNRVACIILILVEVGIIFTLSLVLLFNPFDIKFDVKHRYRIENFETVQNSTIEKLMDSETFIETVADDSYHFYCIAAVGLLLSAVFCALGFQGIVKKQKALILTMLIGGTARILMLLIQGLVGIYVLNLVAASEVILAIMIAFIFWSWLVMIPLLSVYLDLREVENLTKKYLNYLLMTKA